MWSDPIQGAAPIGWKIMITISSIIAVYGVGCILYLLGTGIGVWGLNKTVGWAWDITNFVWWVGIGHAGTLDFGGIAVVPPEVANGHQPFCGGHDHFCGNHGGDFPRDSHGKNLGELLGFASCRTNSVRCGSTSIARCCGTYLPFRHISLCLWCFGTSA